MGVAVVAIRRDYAGRARAEAELSRFFDLSLELFVISSPDGYFKRMSRAVTEMLGYSVEEALRIPYMELIHPEDRTASTGAVEQQLVRGERVEQFTNRLRHKDGSWRTLSWRSVPHGGLMYASARDVTDAVRAEHELREAKDQLEARVRERTHELEESHEALSRSERRFRALIENGSDAISLIDSRGKFLYASPAITHAGQYRSGQRGAQDDLLPCSGPHRSGRPARHDLQAGRAVGRAEAVHPAQDRLAGRPLPIDSSMESAVAGHSLRRARRRAPRRLTLRTPGPRRD